MKGESAYLDHKWDQFRQSVSSNPLEFANRVSQRFFGETLWYVPLDRTERISRFWTFCCSRVLHPLAFISLLVLYFAAPYRRPLKVIQLVVCWLYCIYLLPYVVVSYYDRYAVGLLGVKALLVIWCIACGRDFGRKTIRAFFRNSVGESTSL